MAVVWRVGRWVLVVLLVLLLVLSLVGVWTVRRSFPDVDGDDTLASLEAPVDVLRDEWGVVHIYGDSPEDLVRAQGYVHAQDRFFEMDVRRHITGGRLSELFGESQLDTDRYLRTAGWRRTAEAELDLLTDRTRSLLDAYAEGVNAYVADRSPAELSLEYAVLGLTGTEVEIEPWTPTDSVAWLKAMAWELRSNPEDEIGRALLSSRMATDRIEQLFPSYPFERFDPVVTEEAAAADAAVEQAGLHLDRFDASGGGLGSNAWAVAGGFTETGGALLANDPHLSPSQPSIWHQVGLHCRERSPSCPLDVAGYGFSGVPGVVIGRNHRIVWGLTTLASDVADHYVERVDGDRYLVDGEWRAMEVRTEVIEVAGGEDVELTVRETRHGPVMSDVDDQLRDVLRTAVLPGLGVVGEDGHAISLRWTALEPGRTFDALYAIDTAEDFEEFRAGAALFEVPAQNFVYADVDGHIGYQAPGKHPIRAEGHDGRWPVAGWTTDTDWQGYVPFEELPTLYDPPEGYIATANEPVTGPGAAVQLPGSYAPGFRADRIDRRLREALADGTASVDELLAIQLDDHIGLAEILLGALAEVDVEGHTAEAQQLLDGWDGSMAADSASAAYFGAVYRQLLLGLVVDDVDGAFDVTDRGRWWLLIEQLLDEPDDPYWDDLRSDAIEDRDAALSAAMVAADEEVTELLGDDVDAWQWGDLHGLTATHSTLGASGIGPVEALFNRGPYAVAGSGSVVDATGWDPTEGYDVTWVPSMRMVVDTSAPDEARWINLTGQSGHAFHEHYSDMAATWAAGGTIPWFASRDAIERAAVDTATLRPRP